jgi:hypothetical protein
MHFVCTRHSQTKKVRYKNFLHEVARSWISEVQITVKSNTDDLQMPKKQTTPRDQNWIHQADSLVISEHTSWKKLLLAGRGKKVPCKTV